MITVLNRHTAGPASGEYIGRGTALGNPFGADTYGRRQAIKMYRDMCIEAVNTQPQSDLVLALKDVARRHNAGEEVLLLCSCKPKDCHGDVIVELIEEGYV